MSQEITYELCVEYYEYFYSKISNQQNYEFRPRKREEVCIENFLKRVESLFGEESLFNYLCFGFSKYEGLETSQGKNNIPCSWVFGQKTFGEYQERDHEKSAYWVDIMKKNYQIKKSDLIKEEGPQISLRELDSRERKRFADDLDRQLVHCYENDLRDDSSSDCIFCKVKKKCSEMK